MNFKHLRFVFILLFIIPLHSSIPALLPERNTWLDAVTLELCEGLEDNKDRICIHLAPDGTLTNDRFYLRTEYLRGIVLIDYDAALLNPSWGSREEVTIRLLSYQYDQSDFDSRAFHFNKKWNSWDWGMGQANDVHQRSGEWARFCRFHGLDDNNPQQLFNPRINSMFIAHLNEIFCQDESPTLPYNRSKKQKKLYQRLERLVKTKEAS